MAARVEDWLRQAEHDFGVTETTAAAGQYDWACFAAQQAAEKALKALYQHHHSEGWGHSLDRLIAGLVADEPGLASSEKPRRSWTSTTSPHDTRTG